MRAGRSWGPPRWQQRQFLFCVVDDDMPIEGVWERGAKPASRPDPLRWSRCSEDGLMGKYEDVPLGHQITYAREKFDVLGQPKWKVPEVVVIEAAISGDHYQN